ncbi:MAG: type IV pilin protein [Gemmatimonadaceae bacterium]
MQKNTRKGFTLIELLIVVVIIGILAAIAIPKFAATKDKAKLATVKTDVRNIMSAMEAAASNTGSYPVTLVLGTDYTVSNGNVATIVGVANGYTVSVVNDGITTDDNTCSVGVGASAPAPALDGTITCP